MLEKLFPKQYLDSVYEIDFDYFKRIGFEAIVFDIDNTMVPHGAPATQENIELFERLHKMGFQTCALSNNKEPRVKMFCDAVHSQYIYKGGKPSVNGYERAMEKCGSNRKNTLFIGDQIFTDIWGANKAGLYSILLKPIHPKEEIQIVLKRKLEWFVLKAYKRSLKKRK